MSNGNGNGKSIAGSWTAAVIMGALGIVVACFWYLLNVSSQLQEASTKIVILQQQVQELTHMKDTQLTDEGIIGRHSSDIEELKRRMDARAK